jgi:molybdopterin converting factor small subunit
MDGPGAGGAMDPPIKSADDRVERAAVVKVRLGASLKAYGGGQEEFEVEATNIRQLLTALGQACPKLAPILEAGVAVAIDGEIYRNDWFHEVKPGSEVYILPRIAGG